MKQSALHSIITMLVALLVVVSGGSATLAWCQHFDTEVDGHFVIDNSAALSHSDSESHDHAGHADHEVDVDADCHGCVHIPVTSEVSHTGSVAQSFMSSFSFNPQIFAHFVVGQDLFFSATASATLRSQDISFPANTQLAALRTSVLLI